MSQSIELSEKALDQYLDFAKLTAVEAGNIMREFEGADFTQSEGIQYINEFVADKIEIFIHGKLQATFPEHGLFGIQGDADKDYVWICDYVDGAFCYSKGHRVSVTSIALTRDDTTLVSVVYNPWTNELFSAAKNSGAWCNDERMLPAPQELREGTLIDVEWWPWAIYDLDAWLRQVSLEKHAYVLHIGSVIHAACLVAKGVFGACALAKHMVGKNHEVAAVQLILEEAGCIFTDLDGKAINEHTEIKGILAGNVGLHEELVKSYADFAESN